MEKTEREDRAAIFHNVVIGDVEATCTTDDRRRIIGKFSLNKHKNSWKYKDDEIQLQVFSNDFNIEKRADNNGKWNRIEFYFKKEQVPLLIKALKELSGGDNI